MTRPNFTIVTHPEFAGYFIWWTGTPTPMYDIAYTTSDEALENAYAQQQQ